MPTHATEALAGYDRFTTRRAPSHTGAAITAKPVTRPQGRIAPRTRRHQAFIPLGGTFSYVADPGTVVPTKPPHTRKQLI